MGCGYLMLKGQNGKGIQDVLLPYVSVLISIIDILVPHSILPYRNATVIYQDAASSLCLSLTEMVHGC